MATRSQRAVHVSTYALHAETRSEQQRISMYCVWTVGSSLSKLKNRKEQHMDFIFNLLNEIHMDMEQEKITISQIKEDI